MFPIKRTAILLSVFFVLTLFFETNRCTSDAAEINGKAVAVFDGDSFIILDELDQAEFGIRIHGIDAPEKGQPFAEKARKRLSDLMSGKRISVRFKQIDQYGRILGTVRVDGKNIALTLLSEGMAWHYSYFSKDPEYIEAEKRAKQTKSGLWTMPEPTPPWRWRWQNKVNKENKENKTTGPQNNRSMSKNRPAQGNETPASSSVPNKKMSEKRPTTL